MSNTPKNMEMAAEAIRQDMQKTINPEGMTTEDKIYQAISIAYTKNLLEHMRKEREKYKAIEAKLKEKNNG